MATPARDAREFDIVLFGATGFTGGLTAEYLARNAPESLRWAIAGRSTAKLEEVRKHLSTINAELADLPLLQVDASDVAALAEVAGRTKVVASTVGPYLVHGQDLVGACAGAGTDYLDITGEPEFVDVMYAAHHATAVETGARLIHCCGFDSIPHDLGAYFTVKQLDPTQPMAVRGVVRAGASFSGGTFHSAMGAFSRARQMAAAAKARRALEGKPEGRSVRAVAGKPHRDKTLGYWLLPMPTIDPQIVVRSAAALAAYGPKFSYSHFAGTKTLRFAVGGGAFVTAATVAAQVPPVRKALLKRVPAGVGPDEKRRAKSWFAVTFVGEQGERTVQTRVSGGDPGYTETSKMLAESALCLLFDDNPTTAGQVTTAQAMGDALIARLDRAGIVFEVI